MKDTLTTDELKALTFEEAETAISNAVYQATALIERLESVGKVRGNGHHARQAIAKFATEELESRWKDRYYAIIGSRINKVIGVCSADGKADVLAEEPGSTFAVITKAQFEQFGDDEHILDYLNDPVNRIPARG